MFWLHAGCLDAALLDGRYASAFKLGPEQHGASGSVMCDTFPSNAAQRGARLFFSRAAARTRNTFL